MRHHKITGGIAALGLVLALAAAPSVLANPPGHAKGGGQGGPPPHAQQGGGSGQGGPAAHQGPRRGGSGGGGGGGGSGGSLQINVSFHPEARTVIHDYYRTQYGTGCPPGLAKKNNGCLPPGQAKKRWAIGQPIPGGVTIEALPGHLRTRLPPPPGGYYYGMVDREVLLIAEASKKVIDAVVLLSAL